jgi:muramoyltetrapeptide carboxypeptidase LdcA involved in peptidoglycan recycling
MIRYSPCLLQPGDRIAVVAFSSGVTAPHHSRLDRALDGIRMQGYTVIERRSLRQQHKSANAPASERAE